MARTIVTSALPYTYSLPHLGNFIGSVLPADVYYKYLLMKGEDAVFICGSDQHGTPIELRAIKEGVEPQELADAMHEKIKRLFADFGCTFSYFGKTHSDENRSVTYDTFNALKRNGYIKEVERQQAYCRFDKRFLVDRLIEGTCPYCGQSHARGDQCDDCGRLLDPHLIINPTCSICGRREIEFVKSKNLAIELEKLAPMVEDFIKRESANDWTKNAVNKSLSYIGEGLRTRDITRHMKWGFPVPEKGYEDSVFYVWFDAPLAYIAMTKEWNSKRWADYWDGSARLVQFMGKDNIEFHTVFWPALIIGSGVVKALPNTIRASEFLNFEGQKFSKSRGIGIDMVEALEILDADYWRFVLMHIYPETGDSEFYIDETIDTINTLMNDKIGNFIHRVLKMAKMHSDLLPKQMAQSGEIADAIERAVKRYTESFDGMRIREALQAVVELAGEGNAIMSNSQPWAMAKKAKSDKKTAEEFASLMSGLLSVAYTLTIMLWPFCPSASGRASVYFGIKEHSLGLFGKKFALNLEDEPEPIFSKLSEDTVMKLDSFRIKGKG
ncbi:MAG: methionine--tRNA ligase [Candidatus Micrarchaeota archaeon]|nr:methionine--tRNA ligase [Candidatus Micrarchaeota archaeon]